MASVSEAPVPRRFAGGHISRRRGLTMVLLAVFAGVLLASVPGLAPVGHDLSRMSPWGVVGVVGFELASCLSYVVAFRGIFDDVPADTARRVAWTEMGSGVLIPGGGVGGLAVGGWLLSLTGMRKGPILRRSSALFFLTSGVSSFAVIAAGTAMIASGVHTTSGLLLALVPTVVAAAAIGAVMSLPRLAGRASRSFRRARWKGSVADGIRDAERAISRPGRALFGAAGYLLFDIGALWAAFAAAGVSPPVPQLALAYLIGYLANSLPLPGGFGVLDAGLAGALAAYGLDPAHATAAVLVYHAAAFWVPGLGGLLAYASVRGRLGILDESPSTPQARLLEPMGRRRRRRRRARIRPLRRSRPGQAGRRSRFRRSRAGFARS